MRIDLQDIRLSYCGRIGWESEGRPEFIFPATSLQFCFYGNRATLAVTNFRACWENYVGAIVDGVQKVFKLKESGITELELVSENSACRHEVLFFKRMDSCHVIRLEELELDSGAKLLEPLPVPKRRIEVYGDSVSAGEVSEAVAYVGKEDPPHEGEYSNSWYSYAWIAARKLQASLHDIAQGGIGLLNGTGWVAPPDYPGMEQIWDKTHYHPQLGKVTGWDFASYRPHLVIIAIGQNDSHPRDYMKENPKGEKAIFWKQKYRELVLQIRGKYPKAVLILATTILEHEENWDQAIEEVCGSLGDERVLHFLYSKNGCGTPGHVRIAEAEEMADELVSYINTLPMKIWGDEDE